MLARDLRCRIIELERILEADNVIFKTDYLAQLNTKLCSEHSSRLEIVNLVHMYGDICGVLAGEIRQRKINNHSDLFSHAVFLVPFEQFIALLMGRSSGPTPVEELLTVLVKIITSASVGKYGELLDCRSSNRTPDTPSSHRCKSCSCNSS